MFGILENPALRQRLAAAGRSRILSHHSWHGSMRRLDNVIERCMAKVNEPAREKLSYLWSQYDR